MSTELIYNESPQAEATLVLAHGAGAPMDHPFMTYFAERLCEQAMRVVRFEFPYMALRRVTGKRRPPDREAVLRACWHEVIDELGTERLFVGGKSLGGRIASLVADEAGVAGLVCLGYPFHPPGKPGRLRVAHLQHLVTPALIAQGERDPFGNRDDVAGYALSSAIEVHWLADGDHSLKPRKASGRTEQDNWQEAIDAIAGFVKKVTHR